MLVNHLRNDGIDAHGIDRELGGSAHDWLTFDLGNQRWGTIIAHHSYSLHFMHHHFTGAESTAHEYARAFTRYLHALRTGGTFAYAPSLPFIERVLPPTRWDVRTVRNHFGSVTTTATRITRQD